MLDLNDNHPDYFDDDTNSSADPAGSAPAQQPDVTPAPGSTLDFGGDDTPDTPRPRRRWRRVVAWVIVIAVVLLAVVAYLRYFNPYATDARIDGYIVDVERRGIIFKTYEAEIITEASLTDTARVYSRHIDVTIPSEALARELQSLQGSGRPVSLTASRYYGMLPWRGGSTVVVTGIRR